MDLNFICVFRELRSRLFDAEERYKYAHKKEVDLREIADDLADKYHNEEQKYAQLNET